MQIAKAKRGDARGISTCRRESIQALKGIYSREGLNVLLLNSFEESVLHEIKSEEVYCILRGKKIIANVTLSGMQISGLYVKPEFFGFGYGQKLLEFIEKVAREKGIYELEVYSTINAKNFYLHNGYVVEGVAYSLPFNSPVKFFYMKKILENKKF